jgi:beta-glucanase (GH16 family)
MNTRTDFEGDGTMEDCPTHYTGPDFSKSFHVFTLIWTPHKLEWYVDGELKRVSTLFYTMLGQTVDCYGLKAWNQYILNRAFPKHAMTIIADNIIHILNPPDDDTVFPNYYEIDYIRYYTQEY